MWRKIAMTLAIAVPVVAGGVWGALRYYVSASQDPEFFEDNIRAFEQADLESPPPRNVIVFTGSSSIRRWSSLAADMAPLSVINRGFGGSHVSHLIHFASRIITPYSPRAVVTYSGGNDLAEGTGKTAESVASDYQKLVDIVHETLPETRFYILSIKPSKLFFERWGEMSEANRLIAEWCASDPRVQFVDVASVLLGSDGKPRDDVFVFDGLHLNATGYAAWTEIVRGRLLADLGPL